MSSIGKWDIKDVKLDVKDDQVLKCGDVLDKLTCHSEITLQCRQPFSFPKHIPTCLTVLRILN